MTEHRLALRVAALGALRDKIAAAEKLAREELWAEMRAGDRQTAHYAGRLIGAVTAAKGRITPMVFDPDAFASWVAENYPTEVVHKPVVRESYKAAVLAASKRAGEPCTPDGRLDVPGIRISEGDPFLQLRLTDEAAAIVLDMVRDGVITASGELLQLEGGVDAAQFQVHQAAVPDPGDRVGGATRPETDPPGGAGVPMRKASPADLASHQQTEVTTDA